MAADLSWKRLKWRRRQTLAGNSWSSTEWTGICEQFFDLLPLIEKLINAYRANQKRFVSIIEAVIQHHLHALPSKLWPMLIHLNQRVISIRDSNKGCVVFAIIKLENIPILSARNRSFQKFIWAAFNFLQWEMIFGTITSSNKELQQLMLDVNATSRNVSLSFFILDIAVKSGNDLKTCWVFEYGQDELTVDITQCNELIVASLDGACLLYKINWPIYFSVWSNKSQWKIYQMWFVVHKIKWRRTLNVMAITQSIWRERLCAAKNHRCDHRICLKLSEEALDDALVNEDYDFCPWRRRKKKIENDSMQRLTSLRFVHCSF